jgi:hypothetical protein
MSRRIVFILLFAPVLAGTVARSLVTGSSPGIGPEAQGASGGSATARLVSGLAANAPVVFTVAGACAIIAAALLRARASGRTGSGAPLPWVALAGALWFTSLVALRGQSGGSVLLVWAAVCAGAVAVADAALLQRERVRERRSTTPAWAIIGAAVLLFPVQPLLFPIVALSVTLLARQEEAAIAGRK